MKNLFLLLILFALASCTEEETGIPNQTGNKWKLVKYVDSVGKVEAEPTEIERSIKMSFTKSDSIFNIQGQTVRNEVSGKFTLHSSNKIKN